MTSDWNEDFDHFLTEVQSICSVLVPRSIVEVFVIFMALLYLDLEGLHGGWGERVVVDGGLDHRVVFDCSLSLRSVCDGCDGGRVSTMLCCCGDVQPLLFFGDVSEAGEEGVDTGQDGVDVAKRRVHGRASPLGASHVSFHHIVYTDVVSFHGSATTPAPVAVSSCPEVPPPLYATSSRPTDA